MIKQLLIIFLIMLGSASMANYLLQDPGYILIQIQSWRIESSLVLMLLCLSIALMCIFLGMDIIKFILCLPIHIYRKLKSWRQHRQEKQLKQGLDAFFKGEWLLALKKLKHPSKTTAWPLDLISAQAAQNQGLIKERDQFLQMAALEAPKERETILMFQAQLQFAQGQFEQAQASLKHLESHAQHLSSKWYLLQTELYLHFTSYQQAFEILTKTPDLAKQTSTYPNLFKRCIQGLSMQQKLPEAGSLLNLLKKQSPEIQQDMGLLKLLHCRLSTEKSGQKWLLKKLEQELQTSCPNQDTLDLLSEINADAKSLQKFEGMLLKKQMTPNIHLTLAKIKTKQHLWGAALNEINQAIKEAPSKEAYTLMAEIYLSLNQNSNALEAMQKALGLG